jgi:hypothetical protein
MISLVDPSELANVLRPTVYDPTVTRRDAVVEPNPRFDDDRSADERVAKKSHPDRSVDSPRY